MSAKRPQPSRKPDRNGGFAAAKAAFGAALKAHLFALGTRPGGAEAEGWTAQEFADRIPGQKHGRQTAPRTVEYWLAGRTLPEPETFTSILLALFGPAPAGGEARQELRTLYEAARRARTGQVLATAPRDPAGEVAIAVGTLIGFDRAPAEDDVAAAQDPGLEAELPGVIQAARELAGMAERRHNQLTDAFADLAGAAKRFLTAIDAPPADLPHRIRAAHQACVSLASLHDLDDLYRKVPEPGETPLPADLRTKLGLVFVLAAPLLHHFPSIRRRDTALRRFLRPDDLDASRALATSLEARGDLVPDALDQLRGMLAIAGRPGPQGTKGQEQLVGTIINILLFGGASIAAASRGLPPELQARLVALFRENRTPIETLAGALSPAVAVALRHAAGIAVAALDGTSGGLDLPWPPRAALAQWRDPIPGLPEAAWPDMVTIPAGRFVMGAPEREEDSDDDERPLREVTVRRPFALGRCAVTFAQWNAANAAGAGLHEPSDRGWGRGGRPVINVSWEDAQAYCAWLNGALGLPAGTYRLPTEAEWEYACRAGTVGPFSFAGLISTYQMNYDGNHTYGGSVTGAYRRKTVPVGSLPPNGWGLHEMHGNVWEWVEDIFGPYPAQPTDSQALEHSGSVHRVLRGGSWFNDPRYCRSASRVRYPPNYRLYDLGFRLARTLF